MNRLRVQSFIVSGLLLVSGSLELQCSKTGLELSTSDGLQIHYDSRGNIHSLCIEGRPFHSPENVTKSGFTIVEYPEKTKYEVAGEIRKQGAVLFQEAIVENVGINLSARFEEHDSYISVSGEIQDNTGEDRAIDLIYELPVQAIGWDWWADIVSHAQIKPGEHYSTAISPIGCVNSLTSNAGISLAVAADLPCNYSLEYNPDDGVLLVRFKFGLIREAKPNLRQKAPFGFLIYKVEPEWAYRDALARYYAAYPDIFQRRAMRNGLLLEHPIADERKANPDWNESYFSCSRTTNLANESERELMGIDSYFYVNPGKLEIKNLHELPETYEAAMELYHGFNEQSSDVITKENYFTEDHYIKALIEHASLRDKDGKYTIEPRNRPWGGNMVTFPMNPDPDLFGDRNVQLYSHILLDETQKVLQTYPSFNGIYFDSFHAWGKYSNYRREHFAYTDFPLTHDDEGKLYINNAMSHLECLLAIETRIKPYGGLVMGNGIRPGQIFNAFQLDLLKVEDQVTEYYPWYRMMSYKKPFYVSTNRHKSPLSLLELLKQCTLYSHLPTRMAPGRFSYAGDDAALVDRYVPVIIQESELGWEPVPYAVTSDPEIQIERFGSGEGNVMFAIYNRGDAKKSVTLKIDTNAIGMDAVRNVRALIGNQVIAATNPLMLTVDAGDLEVIEIGNAF